MINKPTATNSHFGRRKPNTIRTTINKWNSFGGGTTKPSYHPARPPYRPPINRTTQQKPISAPAPFVPRQKRQQPVQNPTTKPKKMIERPYQPKTSFKFLTVQKEPKKPLGQASQGLSFNFKKAFSHKESSVQPFRSHSRPPPPPAQPSAQQTYQQPIQSNNLSSKRQSMDPASRVIEITPHLDIDELTEPIYVYEDNSKNDDDLDEISASLELSLEDDDAVIDLEKVPETTQPPPPPPSAENIFQACEREAIQRTRKTNPVAIDEHAIQPSHLKKKKISSSSKDTPLRSAKNYVTPLKSKTSKKTPVSTFYSESKDSKRIFYTKSIQADTTLAIKQEAQYALLKDTHLSTMAMPQMASFSKRKLTTMLFEDKPLVDLLYRLKYDGNRECDQLVDMIQLLQANPSIPMYTLLPFVAQMITTEQEDMDVITVALQLLNFLVLECPEVMVFFEKRLRVELNMEESKDDDDTLVFNDPLLVSLHDNSFIIDSTDTPHIFLNPNGHQRKNPSFRFSDAMITAIRAFQPSVFIDSLFKLFKVLYDSRSLDSIVLLSFRLLYSLCSSLSHDASVSCLIEPFLSDLIDYFLFLFESHVASWILLGCDLCMLFIERISSPFVTLLLSTFSSDAHSSRSLFSMMLKFLSTSQVKYIENFGDASILSIRLRLVRLFFKLISCSPEGVHIFQSQFEAKKHQKHILNHILMFSSMALSLELQHILDRQPLVSLRKQFVHLLSTFLFIIISRSKGYPNNWNSVVFDFKTIYHLQSLAPCQGILHDKFIYIVKDCIQRLKK